MKKYEKVCFNINTKYLEIIDKIVDESDDFTVTRTKVLNDAIRLYLIHLNYLTDKDKRG